MDRAEASVYRNVNLANYRAWDFGRYLVSAKQQIGHGIFEQWRKTRFPSVHERKARRCQELFSANANRTELSDFSERVLKGWISGLDQNSVRKFRLGYVPDKHQPNKGMDVKLPRLHSFLNIVNEYERLKYRHTNGLQEVDLLEVREECRDLYDFLAWIYGDRKQSPWEK
ncbi:MAG TPA: hypothetical protein VMO75_05795 [Chthoniobacterales bacterium]|nr:hypothetical protein [Chthoniobacterales bacterium]